MKSVSLAKLPRTRQLWILRRRYSTSSDLLVDVSRIRQCRRTSSCCPSRSWTRALSQWLQWKLRVKKRSWHQKRFHPWFSPRWRKWLRIISERRWNMRWSLFQLTSTMRRGSPPRMQGSLLVLMCSVLSTSPQLLPLHMGWTRRPRRTSSCMTWAVVPLMWACWPLTMACLKL